MKNLILFLFCFQISDSFGQQNNRISELSKYIESSFPYNTIIADSCHKQFTGSFSLLLQLKNSTTFTVKDFIFLSDLNLKFVFDSLINTFKFTLSRKQFKHLHKKLFLLPVVYQYHNCNFDKNISVTVFSSELDIIKQTLVQSAQKHEKLIFSLPNIVPQDTLFDGIILPPAIITNKIDTRKGKAAM